MKNIKNLIFSTIVVLSFTPCMQAEKELSEEENHTGMSYTPNSPDAPKKYHAYLIDGTGFETDTLPPEGVVAGATMTIVEGNNQTVERTKEHDDKTLFARFEPLQVIIKDSGGKRLKNVRVAFSVDEKSQTDPCQATEIGGHSNLVYVMTDKKGIATLSIMWNHSTAKHDDMKLNKSVSAYHGDGPFSVIATHGETTVCFNLTVGKP